MESPRRCAASRSDGTACQAPPLPSGFCFAHDPDLAAERAAARKAGGLQRSKRAAVLPEAPEVNFADVAAVVALLGETATMVRRGTLDCKVANCLAYIASVGLRALQDGELEKRIAALEERLAAAQKNGTPARRFP
jgi:hypothetical protein